MWPRLEHAWALRIAQTRLGPHRVLFTGAAGGVARMVLPASRALAPQWRLVDAVDAMPTEGFPDRRVCHLGPECDAVELLRGVAAVVHFAGRGKPTSASLLARDNVELVDWLLRGMVSAGVSRIVFASSMHVMGRYPRTVAVRPSHPPLPDGPYAESKLQAESLIREAGKFHGIEALILRIGHVSERADTAEPGNWLAMDDVVRLIDVGLSSASIGVTTVHAVTPHRGEDLGQQDFSAMVDMQWSRQAPSHRQAMKRLPRWYGDDPVAREYRGGVFASGRYEAST